VRLVTEPSIPKDADEREMLVAFLDYHRELMLDKCGGLTRDQLATRLDPSTMTLIGMVYHLAIVEESWFEEIFLGGELGEPWASVDWKADRDWEWHHAPSMEPDEVFSAYRRAFTRSNEIVAATESLDQLSVRDRKGEPWSLRWILIHMIEETARHAGHADLIRESIDGSVGDFRSEST
jgi:uncharacterized damage-inducible protein DinB